MNRFFRAIGRAARQFRGGEQGNSTIQFAMVAPIATMMFVAAYESGMLSTRHVMLERALDVTVRDVRIGAIPKPGVELTHDLLKEEICRNASIIPDCINQLRLEMVVRDLRNWQDMNADVACVDREEEGTPLVNFTNGGNNQLMLLRACSLFDPMMPTSTMGAALPKKSGGAYALVATSTFVLEPFK